MIRPLIPLVAIFLPLVAIADSASEWALILKLDEGPQKKISSITDVRQEARNHLLLQQKTLETFISRYPSDPNVIEAQMKLAAVQAALGNIDENHALVDTAIKSLASLESSPKATAEQAANAGFLKVSLQMQDAGGTDAERRDVIIAAAQDFNNRHPGDRRGPRLLVEAATLCDDTPSRKRELLDQAARETKEASLKQRIADDLHRLDLLGRTPSIKVPLIKGGVLDLATLRGNVVVLIFWSTDSPHSLLWLRDFRIAYESLSKNNLKVVTVGLDRSRQSYESRAKSFPPEWVDSYDSDGWLGALPRSLGINALPSVWILDKKGVVRTINAKSNFAKWIRDLQAE
ncbi:peroxiredoxin [Terrimicrobium sacchariphilum]|jgi:hypothetical protein|uniref:Peroxiredoxin n=1 Tax=Terrimicrobium sacchariphilum TaxID=690879 RepID=A0A146GBT6_TERSA|nr:thioredoxin family protein [Terrimicrobium sacchariphilum]GAT34006.1 peroxiredoxin [Terrimicrobium sacchariphilum]